MAHDKVYAVCESKCFVETLSKKQIEEITKFKCYEGDQSGIFEIEWDENSICRTDVNNVTIKVTGLPSRPNIKYFRITTDETSYIGSVAGSGTRVLLTDVEADKTIFIEPLIINAYA